MTREEKVKNLLTELIDMIDNGSQRDLDRTDEIAKTIIKALSQEPCTDTVSIRKDALKTRVGNIVAYNVEWLKKHWQMEMDIVCGVEPCDDAISREAVLKRITQFSTEEGSSVVCRPLYSDVNNMPSVTQKSGEWDRSCTCSVCGQWRILESEKNGGKYKFCPNCGARMESETETWNGIHGQITAPKGTFKKIFDDAESEDDE